MTKIFDVVAVGNANIDLVFKVPNLPRNDSKIVGKKLFECVGGTVANSACVLGNLGVKVVSLSNVGTDHYAQMILNDFACFQVDTQFINIVPDLDADMAVIFLDDSGEKALVYAPGDEVSVNELSYHHAISASRILYTMPGNIAKFHYMANIANKYKTKVVVDIEPHIADTPEKLEQILQLSDVVIFNLEGFIFCTGLAPLEHDIRQLVQQYKLEMIVVTRGADGAIVVTESCCHEHVGFAVNVVDTTGAGDTFNASFVYAMIQQYTLDKAITFACASAALSIGYLGARGGVPTEQKIAEFINNNRE